MPLDELICFVYNFEDRSCLSKQESITNNKSIFIQHKFDKRKFDLLIRLLSALLLPNSLISAMDFSHNHNNELLNSFELERETCCWTKCVCVWWGHSQKHADVSLFA